MAEEKKTDGFRTAAAELTHRGKSWTRGALILAAIVGVACGVSVGWDGNTRAGAYVTPVSIAIAYIIGRGVVRWRTKSWIASLAKKHDVPPAKLEPVVSRFL